MAPLFRWRADKANDLQLESDPRVAGSVVIGSGTNANYCRGVFIFKDLDASQEATLHNWVKSFINSRVVIFFVASSSDKKSTTEAEDFCCCYNLKREKTAWHVLFSNCSKKIWRTFGSW